MTLVTFCQGLATVYLFCIVDQDSNQTVGDLTAQFVPIIASVLSPPEEQLTPETRQNLIELVQFLHKQDQGLIRGYDNLVALCN